MNATAPARALKLALALLAMFAATAVAQPTAPLRVVSPNGGERLSPGSVVTIRWTGTDRYTPGSYAVDVSFDDGAGWTTIADSLRDSSFAWTVPTVNAPKSRIRVRQITGMLDAPVREGNLSSPEAHRGGDVVFSADGSLVATWREGRVAIWSTSSRQLVRTIERSRPVEALALSNDNRLVAIGMYNAAPARPTIEMHEIATGDSLPTIRLLPNVLGATDQIFNVAFTPGDDSLVVAARYFSSLWLVDGGAFIDTLNSRPWGAPASMISFSTDGRRMLTSHPDGFREWDRAADALIRHVEIAEYAHATYGPVPGSVVGFENSVGRIVDIASGDTLASVTFRQAVHVSAIRSAREGGRFVTIDTRDGLRLWRVGESTPIVHQRRETRFRRARLTADGMRLATIDSTDETELWSLPHRVDVSDESFAIVATAPTVSNVDIGTTGIFTARDTNVASFLVNPGGEALAVSSLQIVGADAARFQILAPAAPIEVPSGGTLPITIRFTPLDTLARAAEIHVATSAGVLVGRVTGRGSYGSATRLLDTLPIGEVPIGSSAEFGDDLLVNTGSVTIAIDSIRVNGFGTDRFTIVDAPTTPFSFRPGDVLSARIRFTPGDTLPISAMLVVYAQRGRFLAGWTISGRGVEIPTSVPTTGRPALSAFDPTTTVVNDDLVMSLSLTAPTELRVELHDLLGRELLRVDHGTLGAGMHRLLHDVRVLPAGTYLLRVCSGAVATTRRVLIRK